MYIVNPLYLTVDHVSGYIEEKEVNKYECEMIMNLHMKIKSYLKNAMMFLMELETK